MTLAETVAYLKKLNVDSAGKVLQVLPSFLKPSSTEKRDEVDMLQSMLNRHNAAEIAGIVERKQLNMEYQRLVQSIISFINSLRQEDLATGTDILDKHFNHILLVCSEERKAYIKNQLFPRRYFPNAQWIGATGVNIAAYEIIFFDDKSYADDTLLAKLLEDYSAYLLWFGDTRKPLLARYPEKAYFCNSPFSVYARLQEMLTFIKYFNS